MANVLTTGSTVACLHSGTATLSSSAKLSVGGKPVLLESEATSWPITQCKQVGTGLTPCTTIVSVSAASTLTVGGVPVLLDSLTGTTNGNPDKSLSAIGDQTKLTAV